MQTSLSKDTSAAPQKEKEQQDQERIERVRQRKRASREQTQRIILDALGEGTASRRQAAKAAAVEEAGAEDGSKDHMKLYHTVQALCLRLQIPLVEENRLLASCGTDYTLEDIARMSGFVVRDVTLPDHWERNLTTPVFVTMKETGDVLAVFPDRLGHTRVITDPAAGRERPLWRKEAAGMERQAVELHRPLPEGKVTLKSILTFVMGEPLIPDFLVIIIGMFLGTLAQTQLSTLSTTIYDKVIPQGSAAMLYGTGAIFLGAMGANIFYQVAQSLTTFRLSGRIRYNLQAAIYMRLFRIPENYYRHQESAEVAFRVSSLAQSYVFAFSGVLGVALQAAFSVLYYQKMAEYSKALCGTALLFLAILVAVTLVIAYFSRRYQQKRARLTGRLRSFLYQVFGGITTIRAYGAEEETLTQYTRELSQYTQCDYENANMQRVAQLLTLLISSAASIVMYYRMGSENLGISMGIFMGFITAYSMFAAAITQAATQTMNIIMMIPMLKDSVDVLQVAPESGRNGIILAEPRGDIRVSNISFRYNPDQAPVLQHVSLHIRPGEYVAIVGETGCGKSTLLRLLLGFEKPLEGELFYDGVSTRRLNMPELRRKMGVVLQDGGLFSGSILRNLQVANPSATDEEIRQAIEDAGLTEEIAAMPMGIHTLVSESAQTISGGQKQRIMIARALVGNPRILLLDEATSYLDNLSQAKVCESLARRKITRIAIAHRLSTVKNCDRIIVLDQGTIVEEGSFDELMARQGRFAELARSQLV